MNVFHDDPEFRVRAARWAVEEEQHGLALGRWAELADPTFDFNAAFARFTAMYRISVDSTESIRGSRWAELCARCVVETGTSSLYSALRDAVDEPVLKAICKNVAADEFRHYRLFFTHMRRMFARDGVREESWTARLRRLRTALARLAEVEDDEIASAYHAGNGLTMPYDRVAAGEAYSARVFALYRERHVRRGAYMFAQAAGFDPEGVLAGFLARWSWWLIERRGRALRPVLAGG
jgi:hypothetical protein